MRALLVLLVLLAWRPPDAEAQRRVAERRPAEPDAAIKIYNLVGSVRVVGWDRDSVAVTGTVHEGRDRFLVGGPPRAIKMVIWPEDEQAALPSHLEVRVPARSQVWVKTATATIEVSGVQGGVDLYSVSGDIRVAGRPRELYAESMGGNVEMSVSTPLVRARTGSGAVTVRGEIDDATVTTVSGGIVVSGGRLQRGRFESVSGDLRFEGDLDRGGSFVFQNHSGAVELRVPASVAADFRVSTFQGEVVNELADRPAVNRELKGKELVFSAGRGGAEVAVRTFSGRILLRKR